jgi:hypothetical protein
MIERTPTAKLIEVLNRPPAPDATRFLAYRLAANRAINALVWRDQSGRLFHTCNDKPYAPDPGDELTAEWTLEQWAVLRADWLRMLSPRAQEKAA